MVRWVLESVNEIFLTLVGGEEFEIYVRRASVKNELGSCIEKFVRKRYDNTTSKTKY